MVENDLKLLEQNLVKKNELLDRLQELYDKQLSLLDGSSMSAEDFDACMDELDDRLQELVVLNEEADELYERLRLEEFSVDGPYAAQIACLRTWISQIMDKANSLQEKEQTNKQKMQAYFQKERKNFGAGRRSSKAALDYYRNMNRSNIIPPQFMDQKK